jgi:hypothetical protein
MAKPTIVTRATKGSSLTWTEGDANITNLRDATLTLKAGTGGTDVISELNGVLTIVAGTNVTLTGDNTAKTLTINASGGSGGIALTDLSVGTEGTASGDGAIAYNNTTGVFTYTPPTAAGIGALVSGGALGTPSSGTVTNLTGTASININGTVGATTASTGAFTTLSATGTITAGTLNTNATITTNGTGDLILNTNGGTNSGSITIRDSANTNIDITPNGTGSTVIKNLEYQEFVGNWGTTSGTIAPNALDGNVQTITLNGNLTINAFTSPVSGQTITLIITTGGTGRTLTSTMLFAGASKTLSTTSTVDILTMSYIGTTYYASLVKGYA